MPLLLLRLGSVFWSCLLRLVASFGHHRRAMARVAIRHEGQEAVLAHRGAPLMWFHVASLGELEQAIPVMQAFRAVHPETPWLLTVYSPSAWHPLQSKGVSNVIDDWTDSDLLAVLPDDLPSTWRNWFSSVPLRALALAKYDLWPNLLAACQANNLPVHAFAAAPSSTAPKPKPSTPTLWKLVTTISVQDDASEASFARIGLTDNVTVDGDPRVERVLSRPTSLDPAWQAWATSASQVVVAGSTWTEEEQALRTLDWHPQRRLVLVPHDVSTAHLTTLDRLWEGGAIRRPNGWTSTPSRVTGGAWSLSTARACCSTSTESAPSLWLEAVTARDCTTSLSPPQPACPSSQAPSSARSGRPMPSNALAP